MDSGDVVIAKDHGEMSERALKIIMQEIHNSSSGNLKRFLVPTGNTPKEIYSRLVEEHKENDTTLRYLDLFLMDELCKREHGQLSMFSPSDSEGYFFYILHRLQRGTDLRRTCIHVPDTQNIRHPGAYDLFIDTSGGIDFCLCCTGKEGNIALNMPGSDQNSITRLVQLDATRFAITVGIRTILSSKRILFVASGEEKSNVVKQIFSATVPTDQIPATYLRTHKNCTYIVDESAASLL